MVDNQQHIGSGDNVAGNKIVNNTVNKTVNNHNNIYILLSILLILIIVLIVWVGKSGGNDFFCKDKKCIKCVDCYMLGCFDVAYDCYQERSEEGEEGANEKDVCSNVVQADKFLVEDNIQSAMKFYLLAAEIDEEIVDKYRGGIISTFQTIKGAQDFAKNGEYEKAIEHLNEARKSSMNVPEFDQTNINEYIIAEIEAIEKKRKRKPRPPISEWNGTWSQYQSGKGGEIRGVVEFEITDAYKGKYTNIYYNGVIHNGELLDIQVTGKVLSGKWHNFVTDEYGLFEWRKTNDGFKGKYSMSLDQAPIYYWNGTKK